MQWCALRRCACSQHRCGFDALVVQDKFRFVKDSDVPHTGVLTPGPHNETPVAPIRSIAFCPSMVEIDDEGESARSFVLADAARQPQGRTSPGPSDA